MLLDFLEKLHALETIEAVWSHHIGYMARFDFDRLLYGLSRNCTPHSFGDRADMLVLAKHHPDYVEGFFNGGLFLHSPMLSWATRSVGPGSWELVEELLDPNDQEFLKLIALNEKFDVRAGYTIAFRGTTTRQKAAIALAAKPGLCQDDVELQWREHGRTILQMNNAMHLKLLTLPHEPEGRHLTRRQREVLEWVGDGKTTQDIAQIMSLRPATIEKHLRLARETLNVETTAQAVLKASFNNQIFVIGE